MRASVRRFVRGPVRRAESVRAVDHRLEPKRAGTPAADGFAAVTSAVFRGGIAWFACSAILARYGAGRCRRAGLEGAAAWCLAEAGTYVLKPIVRRDRPAGAGDAHSSSMPSSHAAGAVGYAVAAGLRAPPLALPLLAAAGVVGWSRVQLEKHFPTDVAVGAVVGASAAALVHRAADVHSVRR